MQVLHLCREVGLVKLGHVALDGTKLKANASKTMSYTRMKEADPKLASEVERWLSEAERKDEEEDDEHGPDARGDELPAWVSNRQKRLERIRAAKAALEKEAKEEARKRKTVASGKVKSDRR